MKVLSGVAAALLFSVLPAAGSAAQIPLLGPKCFGTEATIVGTEGDDDLTGTPEADVIAGLEGNDTIHGLGDGDALCGGDGDDVILGGPGLDGIAVGRGADTAQGGSGVDLLTEFSSDSCGPCPPIDPRTRDQGRDDLAGGPGTDLLSSEGGDDVLDGGGGDDIVVHISRFTSVSIDLTLGRAISSAGGVDELRSIEHALGSVNSDVLRGNEKPNMLLGFWGQDVVDGAAGADWIWATYSGSVLNGGEDESADTLAVANGVAAQVDLQAGVATAREDAAYYTPDLVTRFENVVGSDGDDLLIGDLNANTIEGGLGSDEITGGLGDDYLFGDNLEEAWFSFGGSTAGNDTLDGGDGRDRLNGGPLVDECVNGERYVSCERQPGSESPGRAGRGWAGSAVPWWWSRLEIDYLHDSPAVPDLLSSLR